MESNNKILLNTIILYAKILINIVLSLWTVPLVLRALGQSDYGLYNLVAGVVAMLAFLNNSMTVVTQRYMSVTMGQKDMQRLNAVYNASIRIHIILGIVIVIFLELCSPFLFHGFLNIDADRHNAALLLFQFMVASTLFTVLAVPFDATLNAYENMLVFSIIAIVESVLKLFLALSLNSFLYDRLIVYGLGIALITILGAIVRALFVHNHYKDLSFCYNAKIPRPLYKEMLSYAGWNTFGSLAMIGKNQGIAVVLNLFKGTAINASYGIANQINGILSSFSSSIQKAIAPQLMQREGASDRSGMVEMSFSLIKLATIIFSFMAIPLILEMEQVLSLWLHNNIPPYSVLFCQLILVFQFIFQLSSGLALAIDAVGNIKVYRIVLSSVLILNIPLAYCTLKMGYPPYAVLVTMIIIEVVCLFVRLIFAHKLAAFPIKSYFTTCMIPIAITATISFYSGYFLKMLLSPSFFRIILLTLFTMLISSVGSFILVLNHKEKNVVYSFVRSIIKKAQSYFNLS